MGRRFIQNIDGKIFNEIIRETFKHGISSLSTKEIAKHIHISEPVIFAHFKTKQNLIDQTFNYAWHQIPERAIFPTPDIDIRDPKVYAIYIDRFKQVLSYPKELVFIESYQHSSFYRKDFAREVMAGLVNRLTPIFARYQTGRSEEQRSLMVMRYLENIITELAQIARGVVPETNENIRVAIGTILFGTYGLLTEYKALN
jgi:AcrR family transcriptional regulator